MRQYFKGKLLILCSILSSHCIHHFWMGSSTLPLHCSALDCWHKSSFMSFFHCLASQNIPWRSPTNVCSVVRPDAPPLPLPTANSQNSTLKTKKNLSILVILLLKQMNHKSKELFFLASFWKTSYLITATTIPLKKWTLVALVSLKYIRLQTFKCNF